MAVVHQHYISKKIKKNGAGTEQLLVTFACYLLIPKIDFSRPTKQAPPKINLLRCGEIFSHERFDPIVRNSLKGLTLDEYHNVIKCATPFGSSEFFLFYIADSNVNTSRNDGNLRATDKKYDSAAKMREKCKDPVYVFTGISENDAQDPKRKGI